MINDSQILTMHCDIQHEDNLKNKGAMKRQTYLKESRDTASSFYREPSTDKYGTIRRSHPGRLVIFITLTTPPCIVLGLNERARACVYCRTLKNDPVDAVRIRTLIKGMVKISRLSVLITQEEETL